MEQLITDVNDKITENLEERILLTYFDSFLGQMIIGAVNEGICLLEFHDRVHLEKELLQLSKSLNARYAIGNNQHSLKLKEELASYFDKDLKQFTVSLVVTGTDFQQKVFKALQEIPYGKTVSYKQQSEKLGDLKAIRAVATANGLNRIAIVIPCHRVIGSDGSFVGYAGGIWRKKALLALESESVQTVFHFD